MGIKSRYPIIFFSLLLACNSHVDTGTETVGSWEEVPMQHAQMFTVLAQGTARLVHVFDQKEKGRDTIATYLFSEDKREQHEEILAITLPIQRVATTSTTHVPFFQLLHALDRLVGCTHLKRIMNTAVLERVHTGKLVELSDGALIEKERLLVASPDIVLAFPFGNGTKTVEESFNGPVLRVTEYLEPHPLGRAEWIKFFGILTGKEEQANRLYAGIVQRYDSIRNEMSRRTDAPGVFFGSHWQGEWHASGGGSYMARMIKHAGGWYLFDDRDEVENVNVSLEELVVRSNDVRFFGRVLYQEEEVQLGDLLGEDDRLEQLLEKHAIELFYGNTAHADLFGQAIVEPDVLLADLAAILYKEPDSLYTLQYFSRFVQ